MLFAQQANAQNSDVFIPKKTTVFAEGLGSALFYSFNIDRRFSSAPSSFGARLGGSYLPELGLMVAQGNYVFGKKRLKGEIGLGGLFGFPLDDDKDDLFAPTATAQIRYYTDSGIMLRGGWSPVFMKEDDDAIGARYVFYFWPSFSFGYSF